MHDACMDAWTDAWMNGWMNGCVDAWMDECMHGCRDAWMMDAWMKYIRIPFMPVKVCIQGLIHSCFQQTHIECLLCSQCWDWPW